MATKSKFKPVDPKQDFVAMEKKLLDYWYREGIVEKYLKKNKDSKKKFSFLDGPITANNPMGVHHAWGRTYKDLWQRFYNMQGYAGRFQNGFDEQGLWVEVEVEKELGFKNKKDIEKFGIDKFVNLCKERVKKYSQIQTEQSKRLGYFMDWGNSYHTSSDENNYAIWNFIKVCHQKGYLYKGRDSVPWCPRCGTAISQHEILTEEYKEITHEAVFVKFKLQDNDENLLIWTTTPWTLPSNVAVAVNPDFTYALYQNSKTKEKIIFLRTDLVEGVSRDIRKELFGDDQQDWECVKDYKGQDLVGLKYQGNFDELPALKEVEHRVVAAKDLVNAEEGTGLVHLAPGAGEEDFKIAKVENLAVVESIDEAANYIEGFGDLTGQNAKNNPDLVIDKLKNKGVLLKEEKYKHRYPTCWRCKTELVWRVVDEWYIAMDRKDPDDKKGRTLRQEMVDVAKKINWIPKFGLDRELDWLKNMHDWLISKERYWGLALPIWECSKCGNFEVIGSKDELKERAVDGWDKFEGSSPHRPWIDDVKIKCSKCSEISSRIPDVGNVWLDAGIVPFSTMPPEWFPADFITESFPGQFKNWFYSLIAMSTVLKNENPTKTIQGFATMVDEKGESFHKSKGNAIEFVDGADNAGADIIRWMCCLQNPVNDLAFGYHKADEVRRRFYLILWNVYSFFVTYANSDNWTPSVILGSKATPESDSGQARMTGHILDKWIISRLNSTAKNVNDSLSKFDSLSASSAIEDFVIIDLSTWYIRRSRDRVGVTTNNQEDKDSCYQTQYWLLVELSKLISPFMPFIAEEMYINLTGEESVNLTDFPAGAKEIDRQLEDQMSKARLLVEKVHFARKEKGIKVRQPLAALTYGDEKLPALIEKIIASEVNVKNIIFKIGSDPKLDIKITPALKAEGEARDIIRDIQVARKEAGCRLNQKINIELPNWPKEFENEIKRQTLTASLTSGDNLKIIKLDD